MKILFCRHGETIWNQQGRLQGHLDSDLSSLGESQARQLGLALAKFNPAHILTSDLGRAKCTALLANEHLKISIETSSLLRERGFGALEGVYRDQSAEMWQAYEQRFERNFIGIESAESASEVLNRVELFFDYLKSFTFETLIVICHGEWLRIFQNTIQGLQPWSNKLSLPKNCQVIEYDFKL
ncbi:histidine phosphatase family protein [Shewanella youngdeokensis]|uniref:Histidine phosphatase family protein n=1 Tax=Shewanella youngdeokensis TaxID=2999068 RepID=A0ABZ0K2K8_9GAMM|nr:histidine phosphatase family protein [Shewanella sp. DAU334]